MCEWGQQPIESKLRMFDMQATMLKKMYVYCDMKREAAVIGKVVENAVISRNL